MELTTIELAVIVKRMFHISRHKQIGVFLKDSQTSTGAEIDSFTLIDGTGIVGWGFEGASTGGFIFRQWSRGDLCQIFEILFALM